MAWNPLQSDHAATMRQRKGSDLHLNHNEATTISISIITCDVQKVIQVHSSNAIQHEDVNRQKENG